MHWPQRHGALCASIATSKMSGVNPLDDLTDTLRAILDGNPKARIEDLMPWFCDP